MHESAPRWRRDPQIVDRRSRPISRPSAAARSGQPPQPVRRRRVGRPSSAFMSTRSIVARRRGARLLRRRACCAAQPNCARSDGRFASEAEAAFSVEKPMAKPRRRHRRCSTARCSPRATAASEVPAYGLPRRQPPHAAARAQIRRRTQLRFRRAWSARSTAPRPTPLSVVRELVADGQSFATAILDAQSRLFKST